MVRVPVTAATWSTWKRYCELVGVSMGRAIAEMINTELAAVVLQLGQRPGFFDRGLRNQPGYCTAQAGPTDRLSSPVNRWLDSSFPACRCQASGSGHGHTGCRRMRLLGLRLLPKRIDLETLRIVEDLYRHRGPPLVRPLTLRACPSQDVGLTVELPASCYRR